jgi:hypothetical protein
MSAQTDAPADRKTRVAWKEHDLVVLTRVFDKEGVSGAVAALDGDYTPEQVRAKLNALGFLQLSAADKNHIAEFAAWLANHEHRDLAVDEALARIRKDWR